MLVQELFKKIDAEALADADILYMPPWEPYEDYSLEQKLEIVKMTKAKLIDFIEQTRTCTPKEAGSMIVFVAPLLSTDYEEQNRTDYDTFCVKSEEVKEKLRENSEDLRLKNLERYAYEFSTMEEVMGFEVSDVSLKVCGELTTAVMILEELTFFGIDPPAKNERVDEITVELDECMEHIKSGTIETVPAKEVFERLYQDMLGRCETEDEKEHFRLTHEYHETVRPIENRWALERMRENARFIDEMFLEEFSEKEAE